MARVMVESAAIATYCDLNEPWSRAGVVQLEASGAFQNASFQIFNMEYKVSTPTIRAAAARGQMPASRLGLTTRYFAQNPDSGGKPASESAGMQNRMASSGAVLCRPPIPLRW